MKGTTLLSTAFLIAQESKCVSWKVGAVIAKDGRIISTGINGTVAGQPNPDEVAEERGWVVDGKLNPEFQDEYSKWVAGNVIHAEINALLFAARTGNSIEGASIYVTMSPCSDCAKAIGNSGIRQLFYCYEYPKGGTDWVQRLTRAGVKVHKVDPSELKHIDWEKVTVKCKRHSPS